MVSFIFTELILSFKIWQFAKLTFAYAPSRIYAMTIFTFDNFVIRIFPTYHTSFICKEFFTCDYFAKRFYSELKITNQACHLQYMLTKLPTQFHLQ